MLTHPLNTITTPKPILTAPLLLSLALTALTPPAAAQQAGPSRTINTALTDGVDESRANATLTLESSGSITLDGNSSSTAAIDMGGANATFNMTGGTITLENDNLGETGVRMRGSKASVNISGGTITFGQALDIGIYLQAAGAHNEADPDASTHTLTLSGNARIESTEASIDVDEFGGGPRILPLGSNGFDEGEFGLGEGGFGLGEEGFSGGRGIPPLGYSGSGFEEGESGLGEGGFGPVEVEEQPVGLEFSIDEGEVVIEAQEPGFGEEGEFGIKVEEFGEANNSHVALNIGGVINLTGANSIGVYITDKHGKISRFEISGQITGARAIDNTGGLPLSLNLLAGAVVTGDMLSGTGDDVITLAGADGTPPAAQVTGDIELQDGDDTLTLNSAAHITGDIRGGGGDDIIKLNNTASIDGAVDAGEGDDQINYSGRDGAVAVILIGSDNNGFSAGSATGIAGKPYPILGIDRSIGRLYRLPFSGPRYAFLGIDRLTGSAGADTLTGYNDDATWTLNDVDSTYEAPGDGSTRTLTFNGFENLTGGAFIDTFNLAIAHTGNLSGGAGNDLFILTNGANLTGDLIGGIGNDSFTLGGNAQITGNLSGGEGDDQISLSDAARITGDIDTGPGDDTVTLAQNAYVSGIIDGGTEDNADTLDVTQLVQSATAGVIDYRNFENVQGFIAQVDPDNPTRLLIPLAGGGTGGSNRLVIVDRAAMSAQATATGVLSSAVHNVVNQHLAEGAGLRRSSPSRAQYRRPIQVATNHLLPGLLAIDAAPLLWGQVFAAERKRGQDGAISGHTQSYWGVTFGAEQTYGATLAGLLFGYAQADLASSRQTQRPTRIDSDSLFMGAYGQLNWQGLEVGISLNLGYEGHDSRRTLINRGEREQAVGSYDSRFISPALRLGYPYDLGSQWQLRPMVSVNYTLGWYDGYQEQGATGVNLKQDKRQGKSWNTRLGLGLARWFAEDAGEVALSAGLDSRFTRHETGSFRLAGNSFANPITNDSSVHTAFIGAALRYRLNQRLNLEADLEYHHDTGEVGERAVSGSVLLSYEF